MLKSIKTASPKQILFGVLLAFIFFISVCVITGFLISDFQAYAEITDNDDFAQECNNSMTTGYENVDENTNHNSNNYLCSSGQSYEDYIKANVDPSYSKNDKFKSGTLMILKQTLVDSNKLGSINSMDSLHYGDNPDAELAMYDNYCILYNLDDNSDYYVGYVNTIEGKVLETTFAKNNYNGEVLNDCHYDSSTGLIYVPKSYTQGLGKDGKESLLETQIQMLIAVDCDHDEKVATNIDITLNRRNCTNLKTQIKANALDTTIIIPVGNVNSKNISVIANDNINLTNKSVLNDGNLYIEASPTNITNIKIDTEVNTLLTSITSVFKQDSLSTALDDIPCIPYTLNKDWPATSGGTMNYVGAKYNSIQTVHYDETPSSAPYQECLYGVGGFVTEAQIQTFADQIWNDSGAVDLSNLSVVSDRTYNLFTFYQGDIYKEPLTHGLALKCGHISTPAAHDQDNKEVRVKILAINESKNYAILGFTTAVAGFTHQGGCGIYKVKYESKGGCQMTKDSTCSWSKSNPNYSLEGAKYDIYKDSNCTNYTGVSIMLDANGKGHTGPSVLDSKKTYYVRESSSNTGKNYLYNNVVGSVYIENTNSYNNTIKWETGDKTYDNPANDPAPVKIVKADFNTEEEGSTEGKVPSFENAYYEYKYYTDYFKLTKEESSHSSSYQRHWIMSTDKNGQVALEEDYKSRKVSGDDFYLNQYGRVTDPLGTYVIHETKAPEGYLLSEKTYIAQVVPDFADPLSGAKTIIYDGDTGETLKVIIDQHTGDKATKALEQVKKADLEFDKQDNHANRLTKIPFKITSTTTGEWHVVVTDLNADVNTKSDWCPHTTQTNYFDSLLNKDGSIPASGINESKIDSFFDKAGNRAGVWFCWDKEKSKYVAPSEAKGDNKLGALPYDTYTIEELPVTKNKPFILINQEFTVDTPDMVINLGTLINYDITPVNLKTTATNKDGDKDLAVDENVIVNDRVEYTGVNAHNDYSIKGWLVDKASGKRISDIQEKSFKAEDTTGYEDVQFSVDTRNFVGKQVVVYEEMYNSDHELIAYHRDRTDVHQTLTIVKPSINTYFYQFNTQEKVIKERSEHTEFTDFINYSKLVEGHKYQIKSKIVYDNGSVFAEGFSSTFTAGLNGSGSTSIYMSGDTRGITSNTTLIAFEYLYMDDILIATEENVSDTNQQVYIQPATGKLLTYAYSENIGTGQLEISDNAKLVDRVVYSNCESNYHYKLIATVMDKATEAPLIVDGRVISTEHEFYSGGTSGEELVNITFNTLGLSDKELVVFEKLYYDYNGKWIYSGASHESISDVNQTVKVTKPSISTFLHAKDAYVQTIGRSHSCKIVDKITYKGLVKGTSYKVQGKLVNADGTDFVDSSGQTITYCDNLTASDDGFWEVEYNLDTSNLEAGKKIIAFEEVLLNGIKVCTHEDTKDKNQTVTVATSEITVSTTSRGKITNDKQMYCVSDEGIFDTVNYVGAEPGFEYVLKGRLIDRITGEVIIPLNAESGNDYVEKHFLSKSSGSGSEEVIFDVDTRLLQGKDIVCYEELYDHTGVMRAYHEDIADFYQTTTTNQPRIETDLYQKSDSSHEIQRYAEQHLIDNLTYQNFCPGKDYTVKGVLINKETGEEYINEVTEKPVTAEYSFRPEKENGTLEKLEYIFDSTLMSKDMSLVSYVEVYQLDVKILEHKQIDDWRETVTVLTPDVKTNLYDTDSAEKWFIAQRNKSISDDIKWINLPKDRVLQVYTWLVNQDTGLPITDGQIKDEDAKKAVDELVDALGGIVQEVNATDQSDEPVKKPKWIVRFDNLTNKIDAEKMSMLDMEKLSHIAFFTNEVPISGSEGVSTVSGLFNYGVVPAQTATAMSVLVSEDTVIANHVELNDKDEAIDILRSEIETTLTDSDGNKQIDPNGKVLLSDVVKYKNVVVGKEYELRGKLVRKDTGEEVANNTIKFVPESKDGEVSISFEIETSSLAGSDLVAYEYLYLEGDLACQHEDINDDAQTIHINETPASALSKLVQTGDKTWPIILVILIILAIAGMGVLGCKYSNKVYDNTLKEDVDVKGGKMSEDTKEVSVDDLEHDDTPEEIIEEEISL